MRKRKHKEKNPMSEQLTNGTFTVYSTVFVA